MLSMLGKNKKEERKRKKPQQAPKKTCSNPGMYNTACMGSIFLPLQD
jgi:hypothetical protein